MYSAAWLRPLCNTVVQKQSSPSLISLTSQEVELPLVILIFLASFDISPLVMNEDNLFMSDMLCVMDIFTCSAWYDHQ